jgi:hypothetical protein
MMLRGEAYYHRRGFNSIEGRNDAGYRMHDSG